MCLSLISLPHITSSCPIPMPQHQVPTPPHSLKFQPRVRASCQSIMLQLRIMASLQGETHKVRITDSSPSLTSLPQIPGPCPGLMLQPQVPHCDISQPYLFVSQSSHSRFTPTLTAPRPYYIYIYLFIFIYPVPITIVINTLGNHSDDRELACQYLSTSVSNQLKNKQKKPD